MRTLVTQLAALDRAWMNGLAARQVPAWIDRGFRVLTHLGGARVTSAVTLGLLALPASRRVAIVMAVANAASHVVVQLLKRTVVRPRPHQACVGLEALGHVPDAFSFPSGHACAATAVTLPMLLAWGQVTLPALALAVLVAASRVYLRMHFITDVLVGQLIGAAMAVVAYAMLT
ncbi:MAG: phosphatase PAP2 family protein [Gemmatimonadales bacterium]